jgi:hypothetical protein
VDLDRVNRDDWILAALGLSLAFDLLFLPWLDYTVPLTIKGFSISITSTATGSPHGWFGILAVITALVLVADLAMDRLWDRRLPVIGRSHALTPLVLACATAAFVALKLVSFLHDSLYGFGLFVGLVLVACLVLAAVRGFVADASNPRLRRDSD